MEFSTSSKTFHRADFHFSLVAPEAASSFYPIANIGDKAGPDKEGEDAHNYLSNGTCCAFESYNPIPIATQNHRIMILWSPVAIALTNLTP